MIVICDNCGLKYKVDATKIKGDQAKLTCKGCSQIIIVNKADSDGAGTTEALPSDREKVTSKSLYDPSASESSTGTTDPYLQKRSRLGLTTKVILMMLIVSLIPGLIYFGITFYQTSKRISEETSRSAIQSTEILTSEVNEWADKNIRVLNTIAQLPAMQSMDKAKQEVVLKAVHDEYPWMYLVFTTNPNGANIARSDDAPLTDYSNRQYVQDVKAGKPLAWENLIGKTSHKPALVIAVPIKSNGQIVGVLASAMTLDAITKIVTEWHQGQTGLMFIVDQNGKVIAHQNEKYVQEQKDMSKHPLVVAAQNNNKTLIHFKDFNNRDAIGFSKKTDLNWVLAIQQEKSEAYAALNNARTTALTLFGITVVVILIIAYFASQAIVMPIRKLTDAANRISVGELSVEIGKVSQDEIGDLADAIVRMQDSIRLSIERLRRKKR